MELQDFKEQVVDLASQLNIDNHEDAAALSAFFGANMLTIQESIDRSTQIPGSVVDENYQKNVSEILALVHSLNVDAIPLELSHLQAGFGALALRLSRKAFLGKVDRIFVLRTLVGAVTGYAVGVLMAAMSDDSDNLDRWKAVGHMLNDDIMDRIIGEVEKHLPQMGEMN